MRGFLVSSRCARVTIDFDQHELVRVALIADHVETSDARLGDTGLGVVERRANEVVDLVGFDGHGDEHD